MEILFEDAFVKVAVKPRGVLSEESDTAENMPSLLGGKVFTVHRLDRGVGGVMVYAKTREAAAKLSAAIQRGALKKEYTAVVTGTPVPEAGELRDFLFKDSRQNKSFVVGGARRGAREAVLSYRVLQAGEGHSLVRVQLQTGRSHQIRVQLSHKGWPLVGDGKYGSREKAPYPALYATGLSFPHPRTGKEMHFATPLPSEWPWNLFGSSHFEIERKFLIAMPDLSALAAREDCRKRNIEQTYLLAPAGETHRVRRVEEEGTVLFVETRKTRVSALSAVEEERSISEAEYAALLEKKDPLRETVRKVRYAVPTGAHTAEIDVYSFWQDRATLEVELSREDEEFILPAFVRVIRDVTADKRYKNVNLAREVPNEPLE